MRPKRIGGPAGRRGRAAAAAALVIATVGACGGGGDSDNQAAGAPADAAAPGGSSTSSSTETFAADALAKAAEVPVIVPDYFPAYAVSESKNGGAGTETIKVGKGPSALAVNPNTDKIYVANMRDDTVTVIDGKTKKTTKIEAGIEPYAVAVNKKTNTIYVSNLKGLDKNGNVDPNGQGTITIIDGKTNKTKTVNANLEPVALAVDEGLNKIYVANQGSNDVTVLDGKTNKTKTIKLRPDNATSLYTGVLSPQDIRVNEQTDKIYVTGPQSNTIGVIDGKTNKLTVLLTEGKGATSQSGLTPTPATIDRTRNLIYAANFTSNDVTIIDGATNKMTTVKLEDVQDPYSIKVNPVTNKIYVGNLTSKSVSVIDGATKEAITIGDLPGKPHDVQINTKTNKIYFPLYILYRGNQVGDDKQITGLLLELDGKTNKLTTIVCGVTPYAVAVNEVTGKVYVANQDSNDVTVLNP